MTDKNPPQTPQEPLGGPGAHTAPQNAPTRRTDPNQDGVWLYVNSETGNISTHDTREAAETAAADDHAPWIELVTEDDLEPAPTPRRVWMAPPVLTIHGTSFYNPWSDEDGAA